MRLLLCSLAAAAGMVALAAPAAQAATRDWPARDWPARDFDRVELRSAADVAITAGPRFSVHADGDPRLLERMTATVDRGTLVLGWRDRENHLSIRDGHIRFTITMPRIAGAALSGAGTMTVDRAEAPNFSADIGGAGNIHIASLRSAHATLAMGGTGEIIAAGAAGRLDARVSGVGTIDTTRLVAHAGQVSMSGTGEVRARIDGPVDVNLSGMGHVDISGQPRCTIHKSGLGSVRCG